ncbi:MAG TPA: chemotaxis protein CheA [Gemmatimonadaceae bacterium]
MRMDSDLRALIDVYRAETEENLAAMEHGLLELEELGEPDAELVHAVFRAAHTIKGNSATIGFGAVAEAAHRLEDSLQRIRDGSLRWTPTASQDLLASLDALRVHVREEKADGGERSTDAEGAAGATAVAKAAGSRAGDRETTLRVNLSRLDRLLDLTAEITIARGRMTQLLAASAAVDDVLGGTLWQIEQLHAALHDEVMMLRVVPLGAVFRAQQRTVRDLAQHLGKLVQLDLEGEDVEVDTSISEQLRDPLTHMIRNAVDHGIEAPVARVAAGKSPLGRIVLRARRQSGAVVIEIEDDGRGLDRATIAERSEARGLVDDASTLSDEELFGCIFEPGFSTAHEVTEISGRGVGMDVVRRRIRALRGTINISSTPGQGTRFAMRLPLTVAIINGLLVTAGGEHYVVPMEAVEECVDFQTVHANGGDTGVLNLRGKPVPYARLAHALGEPSPPALRACAMILRHAHHQVGLVVDSLDGDCQAVIKPLAGLLESLPGIAGSTILGSGRVALILDVPQLVELITRDSSVSAVA